MLHVRKILTAAVAAGLTIIVHNPDDVDNPDYVGDNVRDAMDAIEAVDECEVTVDGDDDESGWMMLVNDLDEDEQIADCSGWIDSYMDRN